MKILTLTVLLLSAISLSACNTIKGAGTDIHNAGTALENATK